MSTRESVQHRYDELRAIRVRDSWRILSARRVRDGAPCVLVTPGPAARPADALACLDAIEWAHHRVDHPLIARVTGRAVLDERPVLEFDSAARFDGLSMLRWCTASGAKVPYEAGDALIMSVRTVLQAAHGVHARSGTPLGLSRISAANLLFTAAGTWSVLGLGANVAVENELGVPDPDVPYFQAPELALGALPSAMGDYVALLLFMRSVLVHVDPRGVLARVLEAAAGAREAGLREILQAIERRIVGELPSDRLSLDDAVALAERFRIMLGVKPDARAFERLVAQLFETHGDDDDGQLRRAGSNRLALALGPDSRWMSWGDGEATPLQGASRRIVRLLAERRLFGTCEPVRAVELVELAWPGERLGYEAGLNRVYVTMTRLRKRCPEGAFVRADDGYSFSPDVSVRRVNATRAH